jgi:hypothetical protein
MDANDGASLILPREILPLEVLFEFYDLQFYWIKLAREPRGDVMEPELDRCCKPPLTADQHEILCDYYRLDHTSRANAGQKIIQYQIRALALIPLDYDILAGNPAVAIG